MLDDPPYYVNRKQRYEHRLFDYAKNLARGEHVVASDNPTEGGMSSSSDQRASGDGSEEFRSVIDDLTIENKELKRRLRRLETLHCSHLEEDKLFEVKVHGLPINKKRELEGLLRGFATDLKQGLDQSNCPPTSQESSAKSVSGDPSPVSGIRLQDSAYASHSTSGRNSAAAHLRSKHSTLARDKEQKLSTSANGCAGRVRVRHAPLVSERAKMKPVVRKLEQLFTGRKATGAGCEQSQQVALQSEARSGNELETSREGLREACICLADAGASVDPAVKSRDNWASSAPPCPEEGQPSSPSATPCVGGVQEQRPTHPLDVDPNRAQYPAENIDYIRHLGACSPKPSANTTPQQDEGWVYLNVLTNMAQLHMINVTPEFVRKAITNLSDKLELSGDGRKIRWKGGNEGTNLTSDSGGISSGERGSPNSLDEESSVYGNGTKRRKLGGEIYEQRASGGGRLRLGHIPELMPKKRRKPHVDLEHNVGSDQQLPLRFPFKDNTFDYRPLFFHSTACDRECKYSSTDNSDPTCSSRAADTSIQGTERDGRMQSLKRRREDGPIIFFNSADFCTDLSGDGTDFSWGYSNPLSAGRDAYTTHGRGILGCPRPSTVRTASGSARIPHPLTEAEPVSSEEELSDGNSDKVLAENITALSNFKFSPRRFASDEQTIPLIELEASGVGGVQPSDNFAINVSFTVTRNNSSHSETHSSTSSSRVQEIIHKILEAPGTGLKAYNPRGPPGSLKERFTPPIKYDIISAARVDLPPFKLPSPTYFFRASSSLEGSSSDSTESGALAIGDSSQSSYNQQPSLTESGDCVKSRDKTSSISFIRLRHMLDVDAVARARDKPEGDLTNGGIEVGSLVATTEGSDGSGYESGDDDDDDDDDDVS
ncbi:MAG: hypothetical protein M1839_007294 [Geoglossum umbratile]|nr:MAG: hypothetical protein M1839_007294 [Geoglossum umbratile]